MIPNPIGLRIDSEGSIRDQLQAAARLGLRSVVLEAAGDLAPHRLGETARRELRHILRTLELALGGLVLPTRRPFHSTDQLDDRIRRAQDVFTLAYDLGCSLVLLRAGAVPTQDDPRREPFNLALRELEARADHRGVRIALETGAEPVDSLNQFLSDVHSPILCASLDSALLLQAGLDPVPAVRSLADRLAHVYLGDAIGRGARGPNPRGYGFPPGALDWEEFLGALEEVGYRGCLTLLPDPTRPIEQQVQAILARLRSL